MDRPPIDRVVVLMMENGSFDRMVGALADGGRFDGVDFSRPFTNPDPGGGDIFQAPTESREIFHDPEHTLPSSLAQYAGGTNRGFVADFARMYPRATEAERHEILGVYRRGFLPALHMLAENFVLCDRWFSSMPGPTWINRLFAHAGSSTGRVSEPGSLFSAKLHLYDERTLYDELTDAGVDWTIYFGDVPQSLALSHQFGHLKHYRRFSHFAEDIEKGTLANYVFIEPTYFGPAQNDQHPPHDVLRGDALIAEVYNALRGNPELFAKTLLIVLYDEHGGFCDHVVPPSTIAPDDHTKHFGFDLLGFRVPAVLVSPLLDPGVSSTVFDHTSLLRMASNLFAGVQPLGRRAAVANDPLAAVTWRSAPRENLPEATIAPDLAEAVREPLLEGLRASLFGLTHHLESQIESAAHRSALMLRAHEALGDAWDQAKLATDRLDAWLEHARPHHGVVGRVGEALGTLRHRVGL